MRYYCVMFYFLRVTAKARIPIIIVSCSISWKLQPRWGCLVLLCHVLLLESHSQGEDAYYYCVMFYLLKVTAKVRMPVIIMSCSTSWKSQPRRGCLLLLCHVLFLESHSQGEDACYYSVMFYFLKVTAKARMPVIIMSCSTSWKSQPRRGFVLLLCHVLFLESHSQGEDACYYYIMFYFLKVTAKARMPVIIMSCSTSWKLQPRRGCLLLLRHVLLLESHSQGQDSCYYYVIFYFLIESHSIWDYNSAQ